MQNNKITEVSMKVNQANLMKSLKFSFTNSTTVLAEMMQNARRAGASWVKFEFNPETGSLAISDNGCGIDCIETLLTVAESGWDAEIVAQEHPFGLGFLSALFSCEQITVISKSGKFTADTADILAFGTVEIVSVKDWNGVTSVVLEGFKPDAKQIETQLQRLAKGFPIEVIYNGATLSRPRARHEGFIQTEIGDIYLLGMAEDQDWKNISSFFHVYLQGLPIYHSNQEYYPGHIIHLDSAKFHARLPDRDKLIDEQQVISQIRQVIDWEVRIKLMQFKQQLTATEFVEGYETMKSYGCLDLLNDIPVLPKQVVAKICGYPVKEGDYARNQALDNPLLKEDIVAGKYKIAKLYDLDSIGALPWMYAWYQEWLILDDKLHPEHWLHSYLIDLNEKQIGIEITGESHKACFTGQWVSANAVFCEKYRLTVDDEFVEIEKDAVYQEEKDLFIVPKLESGGVVVGQASSYYDEYGTFHESIREADEWYFQNFVVANTAENPEVALMRLLPSFGNCPALFDKRFKLELDGKGRVLSLVEI